MSNILYPAAAIAVVAVVTWGLRAFPFVLFGRKKMPEIAKYLGWILPPAIMTVLVIYCLRNTVFSAIPFGIPEIVSCGLVILLQAIKKNMYLSIIAGTVCYMLLIRIM